MFASVGRELYPGQVADLVALRQRLRARLDGVRERFVPRVGDRTVGLQEEGRYASAPFVFNDRQSCNGTLEAANVLIERRVNFPLRFGVARVLQNTSAV